MASRNWPWNSPASLRALPIHCPTVRRTPGSSFGPIATSATTAMTTSSLHPISNMNTSAQREAIFIPMLAEQDLGRPRLPPTDRAAVCRNFPMSEGLAANIRPRCCGRRGVVIDTLDGLGLVSGLLVLLHALLECFDALRDIAHQVGNLATTEQQQDDCDHDDPVPNAKRTHPATLQNARPATRPNLSGK